MADVVLELSIHLTTTPGMAIPHVLLHISHLLHKTCHPHAPPVGPENKKLKPGVQ